MKVERIASPWLPRASADMQTRPLELKALRALLGVSLVSLMAVPAALSFVISPALALPVGVAGVGAATLLSCLGVLALVRTLSNQLDAEDTTTSLINPAIFDQFPGLVTLHDPRGFVTASYGRDKAAMLPWLRDITAMGFLEIVHVSDRLHFLQAIDSLRQGAAHETVNLRVEKPGAARDQQQQFLYIRTEMTAVRGKDNELESILAQSLDMSEMENLRQEAREKANEVDGAHEAKTRFLAAVSHELRTPLNAILGFSDILKGEYFGPLANDRQKEYVALINQSGHHLLSVVNTMLDMSKIEAGRYQVIAEPFDVYPAVQTCASMLDLQARNKGVVLTNRVARSVGDMAADQRAIKQILINLVGNAIKFTDKGGVISIDCEHDDKTVTLVVSDTGIGISPEMLARVGQPFMQVQSNFTRGYEGTGLGLSLVKGLVALHGGEFQITSAEGRGTVVKVSFPKDGSGVVHGGNNAADAADQTMVEFPPRLTGSAAIMNNDKDWLDDRTAQAQSA